MSKPLDPTLSVEIAERIKSKPADCFNNAYQAALLTEGAIYVQGFLAVAGVSVPIEYSWIELEDCLGDPTLPHLNSNQELYYFPAQRLTIKQLKAAVEEAQEDYPDDPPLPVYGAPPHIYYGNLMMGGQDYEAAYQQAEAKCRELQPKSSDP